MSRSDIVNELFKPARKNFPRRKVVLKGIDDLVELDLMDMQQIAKENEGFRYVLVVINCFSKKGYTVPLKNKTAAAVAEATKTILDRNKLKFKNAHTDMGTEFHGAFQKLMKDRGINHYFTYTENKASICERFIRTLKNKIYKSMALRANWRYIDKLDEITEKYNNTFHRTIKMAPNKVNRNNQKHLLETVFNYNRKIMIPKFSVGDYVRVSKPKFVFSRGFHPSWSSELFIVHSINVKYPVTYKLSNYDGSEIIKGAFYEHELQKTKNNDVWLVEKVLKKKGNKVLVRWYGFGSEHDTWEKETDVFDAES